MAPCPCCPARPCPYPQGSVEDLDRGKGGGGGREQRGGPTQKAKTPLKTSQKHPTRPVQSTTKLGTQTLHNFYPHVDGGLRNEPQKKPSSAQYGGTEVPINTEKP